MGVDDDCTGVLGHLAGTDYNYLNNTDNRDRREIRSDCPNQQGLHVLTLGQSVELVSGDGELLSPTIPRRVVLQPHQAFCAL